MFKMIKRMSFVIGIILVLILSFSYGTFIYTSDSYRTTEMLVSNLTYGIDITSSDATISGKTVSVSSGKTAVVYLKVTSLNKVDTKYGVDYKITKGTGTVKYASNTGWLPTGKISENNVGTYEKVVKVVIAAETDMSVDFTVTGGFTNNELTEVETGYTRITEKADNVISYNDTLTNVVKKETTNNIYGGESTNNYAQYPINEDNTKNIWRILGTYNGIGTKIVSNQVSTTTKSTLSTDLTSFYNTLEKPDNYILSTDKFACTNTSCTSSSYSKVGLISTSEYEMLGGINSYLASSESYFALDNGTIKNITSGGIEETSTTSGLRPAVYLQDYVTVTGSGTVSDPFKLKMPEYAVVLNVVNGSAALPSKMITRGENATYEITPNTGYKLVLSSNTCSKGTLSGNTFTISNVTSAQTCTITLTPESYTLTLDANGGSVSTTSKTVTYDSTYGDLPTPTRNGYIFIGWFDSSYKDHPLYFYSDNFPDLKTAFGYNEVSLYNHYLDYGKNEGRQISQFISSSTFTDTSNKTLYAGWVRNYSVTLAVTNGSGGGTKYATYGRNVTFNITPNSNYTFAASSISCSSGGLSKDSTNSVYTYSKNNITGDITCSVTLVSKNTLAGKIITKSLINTDNIYWESGYRYEGSNPNNYIYMTNKNTNTKELWRIIGVFPEGENNEDIIRVRRHYAQNSYPRIPYNTNDGNHWPQTTMYTAIADRYKLSYYNNTVNYKMFLGASGSYNGHTPRSAYLFERGTTSGYTSKNSYNGITRFIGSVGLMYWSDYGYATIASSSCPRTQDMHSYNVAGCYDQNWLFQGTSYDQITMVPSTTENSGYVVRKTGYGTSTINVVGSSNPYYHAYSPVMALKIDTVVTGSGTESDPYVIK